MNYPGNPSLSADAQQRILGTFEQTLDLAAQGSRQEALLGCDFVLRMDPHFEPARQLQERLKSATGAVRVDDLKGGGQPAAPAPIDFGGMGGFDSLDALDSLDSLDTLEALPSLDDELPGFGGGGGGIFGELASLEPASPAGTGDLKAQLHKLFDARRLQELLELAQREQPTVAADAELRQLVETAQERLEAEPYIGRFVTKAREAAQRGQNDEVGRLLEKARALDPSHPGIAEIERLAGAASAPAPRPAPAPAAPAPAAPQLPAALRPSSTPPLDLFAGGGSGDSESDRRIAQLLAEGQTAFDAGDPQAAIDAWSRIFLIDIDHQEAARRIDLARKLKAENERQVEEIFHDGLNSLESGNLQAARLAFEQVLALQPSYLAAREYLQQIDSGNVPAASAMPAAAAARREVSAPSAGHAGTDALSLSLPDLPSAGDLKEEILVPPEPGAASTFSERPTTAKSGRKSGGAGKRFVYIGGGVLAVVLAALAVLYMKRDSVWPNSSADRPPAAAPTPAPAPAATDPIVKAKSLHQQGRRPNAIALLKRLPPGDPHYAEAQKLIAQWEAAEAATRPAGTEPGGAPAAGAPVFGASGVALTAEAAARRKELLEAGTKAYTQGDLVHAADQFEQAAALAKLDSPESEQFAEAKHRLQPLADEVKLFRQHDWEFVLPKLWRLRDTSQADRTIIDRMIIDSYYNLGIRDLQRSDPIHAASQFTEALKLQPGEPTLRRHLLFAQTYQERPLDLLFRIYVKYLPYR